MKRLPRGITERLAWYVYLLRDPTTNPPKIFYVGKGKGNRVLAHVNGARGRPDRTDKLDRIRAIHKAGREVDHAILRHGISSEDIAHEIESAAIDLIEGLTNRTRGRHRHLGLTSLAEIVEEHAAKRLTPSAPCLFIKIARKWRRGMSADELYEATRACWRTRKRRAEKARYVLAVAGGIVRAVYSDATWGPCRRRGAKDGGRLEFTGVVARERASWIGRSVEHLFRQGNQNPIKYWRC